MISTHNTPAQLGRAEDTSFAEQTGGQSGLPAHCRLVPRELVVFISLSSTLAAPRSRNSGWRATKRTMERAGDAAARDDPSPIPFHHRDKSNITAEL